MLSEMRKNVIRLIRARMAEVAKQQAGLASCAAWVEARDDLTPVEKARAIGAARREVHTAKTELELAASSALKHYESVLASLAKQNGRGVAPKSLRHYALRDEVTQSEVA